MNDTFVFEQNREEFGEQINDILSFVFVLMLIYFWFARRLWSFLM